VILFDVNVLVYAYRQDSEFHDGIRSWLEMASSAASEIIKASVATSVHFYRAMPCGSRRAPAFSQAFRVRKVQWFFVARLNLIYSRAEFAYESSFQRVKLFPSIFMNRSG